MNPPQVYMCSPSAFVKFCMKTFMKNALNFSEVADKVKVIVLDSRYSKSMKHLYYPFSSFTLEIGYCFKKEILVPQNWQAERVDSSLWFDAQTHVDFNSLRVKAKVWVQAWHFGGVTMPLRPCLLIVTWVLEYLILRDSGLYTAHRNCVTASGVGRWWERLPSPRRVVFDQGCHKADLVSQLQAAVANEH